MPFECRGICHKAETTTKLKDHYARGEKYCRVCERYMLIFTVRCLCCNSILRTNQHKYGKRKALSLRREKKIIEELKIGKQ